MARATMKKAQQNKRHRARVAARHSGRRQTPGMHEHLFMMYPHGTEDSAAEEAGETPQQEAAEQAAGQA